MQAMTPPALSTHPGSAGAAQSGTRCPARGSAACAEARRVLQRPGREAWGLGLGRAASRAAWQAQERAGQAGASLEQADAVRPPAAGAHPPAFPPAHPPTHPPMHPPTPPAPGRGTGAGRGPPRSAAPAPGRRPLRVAGQRRACWSRFDARGGGSTNPQRWHARGGTTPSGPPAARPPARPPWLCEAAAE